MNEEIRTLRKTGKIPWQFHITAGHTGLAFLFHKEGKAALRVEEDSGECRVIMNWSAGREPQMLRAEVRPGDEVVLTFDGCRAALYVDGKLADEEWPLSRIVLDDLLFTTKVPIAFQPEAYQPPMRVSFGFCAEGWRPPVRGVNVGDCMPFVHGGKLHVFYLYDRRHHQSKYGLGAHQWGHISTENLKSWQEYPMAIPLTALEEGSICTGSVLFRRGVYYAFYAVRACDGSPGMITWSVSKDGVYFKKSGQAFALPPRYDTPSARDPKVFCDSTGKCHMLVTTSLAGEGKGCLAHLTSRNMKTWRDEGPFVVMDDERQPECSDYFKWGGYYYLVYSLDLTARYYFSNKPFGPWEAPENNTISWSPERPSRTSDQNSHLDHTQTEKILRVPKSCIWRGGLNQGKKRKLFGRRNAADERLLFCGFVEEGKGYGGTMHFCEAHQEKDGRLSFTSVPEMRQNR